MQSIVVYPPKVSVIVPVYNAETTLRECIDSLLALNYFKEHLELIFVNNASTDTSPDILTHYRREIKTLDEEKKGPAAARNKGLRHANGEIVAFTDSDCIVDPNWLPNIIQPLNDENIGIVGGRILAKRPCNMIEEFGETIHDHGRAINKFKPAYAITMNWASRLSLLRQVGFFDERFIRCEDVDLSTRIIQSGYRCVYRPGAIVYHSNEKTLSKLFHEGYLHGYHSIQHLKVHKRFLKQCGHRRIHLQSYQRILSSLVHFAKGINRDHSMCYFTFDVGKKLGKFVGSARFRYLDL